MGSVSRSFPTASPDHLSALSGSTPPHPGSARPADSSWPPSSSPFEPRDAAGTLRRPLPSPSSIAPNLSPPRLRNNSHNLAPLHSELSTATSSNYDWPFARDSRPLAPEPSSSSNLQSSRMQSTRDPQQQLYNMLPNALAGPSSAPFPPPEPYGGGNTGGGGSLDMPWMYSPNAYPPSGFPGYNPAAQLSGDPGSRADSETYAQVGPAEYTKALSIFRHLQAALPHMRAANALGPPATGQGFRSLVDIASTASDMLQGKTPKPAPVRHRTPPREPPERPYPAGKRPRMETFCRGCGATETPEWRRGPLGPRTLCNACGLVHMKMQRKKKKAEERAAQEAATLPL